MAWKILTLDATFEYVSKNDPDPSNPTLFLLRPLSLRTRNAIADGTMNFSPRQQGLGKATIHLASATTQKAYYGIASRRS